MAVHPCAHARDMLYACIHNPLSASHPTVHIALPLPYCQYNLRTTASEPVTLRLISGDKTYERTMVCATAVSVEASASVLHDQQRLGSCSAAAPQCII
jgi:hypothetical protein